MKINVLVLFFLLFSSILTAEVKRVGSDLNEIQNFVENGIDTKRDSLEKLWRAMKYRLGQEEQSVNNQFGNQQDHQIDDQLNEEKELVEENTEKKAGLENIAEEVNKNGPMNKTIEQNDSKKQPEPPRLEDRPNQMAPITKALLYIRPRRDERWVMLEEGLIKWAISSYLQPYASEVLMNCNLYRDGNMILSVFRGVPLSVGTESWTPPGFLEPAPNYQLRLWNQPSRIGLIDEYSVLFSIVPSADDAFMFNSNPKQLFDDIPQNDGEHKENGNEDEDDDGDIDEKTAKVEPANKSTVITQKYPPKFANTALPGMPNSDSTIDFINQRKGSNGSSAAVPPNIPTGIYALYPSMSIKVLPISFWFLWCSTFLVIYFFIF
ncbi:hypothetical protein K501DRAFT_269826 [Backusella circina FSU 941]|nr:hypothetical protein K501DRAFT_269826 [Backusella circina FSU 941]